jgi:hypothetical protein
MAITQKTKDVIFYSKLLRTEEGKEFIQKLKSNDTISIIEMIKLYTMAVKKINLATHR